MPNDRDAPSPRSPSAVALRLGSRVVHRAWDWFRSAGAVTARRPGPYRFRRIGPGTRLAFPQGTLFGTPWIELGDHCVIGAEVTLTAGMVPDVDLGPDTVLTLGNGVVLGRGSHVVADTTVTVGDDVFCGPYVYITSSNHSYDDPHRPVGRQWPRAEPVEIGPGSWLGAGAVVLPGARLGRNVVVAAGAVVRGEVPDHAVVAGVPARVVRRWDPTEGWHPPLRTPAPEPVPEGATPEQLLALARRDAVAPGQRTERGGRRGAGAGRPPEPTAAPEGTDPTARPDSTDPTDLSDPTQRTDLSHPNPGRPTR